MQIIRYKTNIRNERGLHRIAPLLNQYSSTISWQLDLNSADKVLTVFSPGYVPEQQVSAAISLAGFTAMNLDDYDAIY